MNYRLVVPTGDIVEQYYRLYTHENTEANSRVQLFEGTQDVDIRKYVDFETWYNRDKEIYELVEAQKMEPFFKKLNAYYSTRLNTDKIAEALTWDELTSMGVDQFVAVCYKQTGKRAYSFATKVFNFIDGNSYPILDSYVVTLLEAYLNQDDQSKNRWDKNTWNTYVNYKSAYDSFKDKYQLTGLSYKKTDVFLWTYGSAVQQYWKENGVLSFESVSYKR